jgi:hypothetical protein
MVSPALSMNWPTGGGNFGNPLTYASDWNTGIGTPHAAVATCYVAIDGADRMKREMDWGIANCQGSMAGGTTEITSLKNGTDVYDGRPYLWTAGALTEMNDINEPQNIRADGIATLGQDQALYKGDLLLSTDGHYAAVMQFDGNFVIRDNWTGGVPWAASSCGLSPWAGSRVVLGYRARRLEFG